jgi:hypothetical protein
MPAFRIKKNTANVINQRNQHKCAAEEGFARMSDRVELNFSKPEISAYLTENKLQESYSILRNQLALTAVRIRFLKEDICKWRSLLQQQVKQPDSMTQLIANLHMIQLDIISKLFMLIEDFLIYSFNLRRNMSKLAIFTASENYRVVWDEIKKIEKMDASDISLYLLFPNIDGLELSDEDKEFVSAILDKISINVIERIACVTKFFHDFSRIYIRYKHALPAVIGLHEIFPDASDPNKKLVSSHIYVRDHVKGNPTTYILYTGMETLEYYEKIVDSVGVVSDARLFSHLHSMLNCGRPFLIPIEFYLRQDEIKRWREIVRKVNLIPILNPKHEYKITLAGDLANALHKNLPEHFIYKVKRDMFLQQNINPVK